MSSHPDRGQHDVAVIVARDDLQQHERREREEVRRGQQLPAQVEHAARRLRRSVWRETRRSKAAHWFDVPRSESAALSVRLRFIGQSENRCRAASKRLDHVNCRPELVLQDTDTRVSATLSDSQCWSRLMPHLEIPDDGADALQFGR